MKPTQLTLPVPKFFTRKSVEDWRIIVPYQERFQQALDWRAQHNISSAAVDKASIALMVIDGELTFCNPDFQLFVGGRSGTGAVDDNFRLVNWFYQYMGIINRVHATLDTHEAFQIFHPTFWVDGKGNHPAPFTIISYDDVKKGNWRVNPAVPYAVMRDARKLTALQGYVEHYVKTLTGGGQYPLMIWPFHGMLGGNGHCLVPGLEEAFFFHAIARSSQTKFEIKGGHPLTENYSVLSPEVLEQADGTSNGASKNTGFIETLLSYDAVIIAGQAKSHCVAWTVRHLLDEIGARNPELAKKVYILTDCMSPVVTPQYDFTADADKQFAEFEKRGMNLVTTAEPIENWAGMQDILARL